MDKNPTDVPTEAKASSPYTSLRSLLLLVLVYLCGLIMSFTPSTPFTPSSLTLNPDTAMVSGVGVRTVTLNPLDFGWLQSAKESTVMVRTPTGHGSGVCIDRKGGHAIILTALHVVRDLEIGEESIQLYWSVGQEDFMLNGYVSRKSTVDDLALVEGIDFHGLLVARTLGTESPLFGSTAIAIGFPADVYPASCTIGASGGIEWDGETRLLQHSACIWFGNSGGPLFNDKGWVVGINVMISGYNDHAASDMGLAVPIESILWFLGEGK